MVRHANHHSFHVPLRANRIIALALPWTTLAICMAGSLPADVAGWLSAWRDLRIDVLAFIAVV
jgi:hypothetical protein